MDKKTGTAAELIGRLAAGERLSLDEYRVIIEGQNEKTRAVAASLADKVRTEIYGRDIYLRGLIEIGNYCRNDCFYCGIRKSNKKCDRYKLTKAEIIDCCREGYSLGYRTFVLQGGEGIFSVDEICELVSSVHSAYPECAITLSLGEYPREDYARMFEAGADRYLLRHETADREHYEKLHPPSMSFDNRMRCLRDLKETGFQVGCGFMVGSPFQTSLTLAKDLKFVADFRPDMCGIGPFIPAAGTPFENEPPGTAEQTVYLLSLLRLTQPNLLLPSTTALGTVDPDGREMGILAGANVVMPNLSPVAVRNKYSLYDNKICTGEESAQCAVCLERRMNSIGYRIVSSRGDIIK